MQIADIHMHVVPHVDDGAYSMAMALKMLRIAFAGGARGIICASHSWDGIKERDNYFDSLLELRRAAEEAGIGVELYSGNEVLCYEDNIEAVIKMLKDGTLLTLNGTRHVLTELLSCEKYPGACWMLGRLLEAGYVPVIAHAERCRELGIEDFRKFAERGCLIQINAGSLDEESDPAVRLTARALLREELVSFIGSDAQDTYYRPPDYNKGIEYILSHCTPEYAERVLWFNAETLLGT